MDTQIISGIQDRSLRLNLERIRTQTLNLNKVVDQDGGKIHSLKTARFSTDTISHCKTCTQEHDNGKFFILHGAFEGPRAKVGGLGAFLDDFLVALKKKEQTFSHVAIATPFYDFLKNRDEYQEAELVGFIDHIMIKRMRSSIYKIVIEGVTQFLIKPDLSRERLFDRRSAEMLYVAQEFSEPDDFMTYYNSALAALAASYRSDDGRSVDILHLHTYMLGLTAGLLKTYWNNIRLEKQLKPIKVVSNVHMYLGPGDGYVNKNSLLQLELNVSDEMTVDLKEYSGFQQSFFQFTKYGLYGVAGLLFVLPGSAYLLSQNSSGVDDIKNSVDEIFNLMRDLRNKIIPPLELYKALDLLKFQFEFSDAMVVVSKSLASEMAEALDYLKPHLGGKFVGILSGINTNLWDLTSKELYRDFAVSNDMGNLGNKALAAKKALKKHDIINDAYKALFLYVGRISEEKGIKFLPSIAKAVLANNGQMVVMGPNIEGLEPPAIKELRYIQKESEGNVRLYLDLKKDQLALLGDLKIQKGRLIRLATDVVVIPSNAEACGLVAIESFCSGSLIGASYVQGLKQLCIEKNVNHPMDYFNCVRFNRDFQHAAIDFRNATTMVNNFFSLKDFSSSHEFYEIKTEIAKSCHSYDWDAERGPIQEYIKIYRSLE